MIEVFQAVGAVAGIGGIALAVFLYLGRRIIAPQFFPTLSPRQAFTIINRIILFAFLLGLAGISAYVIITVMEIQSASASASVPTVVPTPDRPPIIQEVIPGFSEDRFEPVEYVIQSDTDWSPEAAHELIRITRWNGVILEDDSIAHDIRFAIKNATPQPITLTLTPGFFSMEDNQGQKSDIIYFCCAAQGAVLDAGQEREVRVIFEDRWAGGKCESGDACPRIRLVVRGLFPVTRASWDAFSFLSAAE